MENNLSTQNDSLLWKVSQPSVLKVKGFLNTELLITEEHRFKEVSREYGVNLEEDMYFGDGLAICRRLGVAMPEREGARVYIGAIIGSAEKSADILLNAGYANIIEMCAYAIVRTPFFNDVKRAGDNKQSINCLNGIAYFEREGVEGKFPGAIFLAEVMNLVPITRLR
jgi:hypothetical protein